MVRKHNAWTRSRQKRSRPKTPAPKTGWVIAELSQLSGVPVRRLRDYVFRDLIQPLERRGTATRYQRGQLVRLMAIKRLRAESGMKLADIKRKLDAMGERELEAWISNGPLPSNVLQALGHSPSPTPAPGAFNAGNVMPVVPAGLSGAELSTGAQSAVERSSRYAAWYHVQLLPGLMLQVSATASPAVRKAAERICEEYVGNAGGAGG